MKTIAKITLFLIVCFCGLGACGQAIGNNCSAKFAERFSCWKQGWDAGEWQSIAYEPNISECGTIFTQQNDTLFISVCQLCHSIRVIDLKNKKERILLSPTAQEKNCKHVWRAGFNKRSFDPIWEGDMFFVVYKDKTYVVLVKEILGSGVFDRKVIYQIAQLENLVRISGNIKLKELAWKEGKAETEIPIGARGIKFIREWPEQENFPKYFVIEYDQYYGGSPGPEARPDEDCAHIAIVHKSNLKEMTVIDLTQFRFKTWEDGMGNRCDKQVEKSTVKIQGSRQSDPCSQ